MLKNKKIQILAITILLCAAYMAWVSPLKSVRIANLKIIDAYFDLSSRIVPVPEAGNDIVLVTIDDESLRRSMAVAQKPYRRNHKKDLGRLTRRYLC
jgi:CHASE2 domain-containing sensor protein